MNQLTAILKILAILPLSLAAQTPISGVVNSYYKVVEVIPAKSCVRVDNPAGLYTNDRIMLVQMKGATVNTTNSSAFGSVTANNNAGNYELSSVCTIRGDSIFFVFNMLRAYSVAGKVQLVRIPQYENVVVVDTLRAAPWDSATGKGGILAITVYGNMVLNAPVSVNRSGYRGGAYLTSNTSCNNFTAPAGYFYDPNPVSPQSGASKGESIADPGPSYRGGKGALANGGGGGNNHNNGGGGGANLGAGGSGGGNSSTSGCTASNPGIGGYALGSESGNRIYMGGGGASGHANSGMPSLGGGRGAGMMFIQANRVYSNGQPFLAQGQKGGNVIGDGAGGGGAGGSILFAVNNFMDAVTADARGGEGGNESDDNTAGKCYGEGGGGGGGAIYFRNAVPAGSVLVTGGAKGLKQDFVSCTPLLATAGTNGSITASYSFRQSATLSTYCGEITLPVQLADFRLTTISATALLEWEISSGTGITSMIVEKKPASGAWKDLESLVYNTSQHSYRYSDKDLKEGAYFYRIRFIFSDGTVRYSSIKKIEIGFGGSALVVYPNPASGLIHIIRPDAGSTLLRIYNNNGQLVHTGTVSSSTPTITQNISFLPKGLYRVVMGNYSASVIVK